MSTNGRETLRMAYADRSCDRLDDLFPGTGAVGEAWVKWVALGGPKIRQALKTTNDLVYGETPQRPLQEEAAP